MGESINLIMNYKVENVIFNCGKNNSLEKEFIKEINPKYSIISDGKNNRYGHPNDEELYNLSKSIIYRTNQDGSIMFKIKNNKLKIETFSP